MSYLIDGIRHCDLNGSFFLLITMQKHFFRKSNIESCRQAVESSSIWDKKIVFLKSIEMLWKLFKTDKKLSKKSHGLWFLLKTIPSMRNRLSNYQIGST